MCNGGTGRREEKQRSTVPYCCTDAADATYAIYIHRQQEHVRNPATKSQDHLCTFATIFKPIFEDHAYNMC